MPDFTPQPLLVTCDTCGMQAQTFDGEHPDWAVQCECCPHDHDHTGLGCRTVTITAVAQLSVFDVNDLMNALGEEEIPVDDIPLIYTES